MRAPSHKWHEVRCGLDRTRQPNGPPNNCRAISLTNIVPIAHMWPNPNVNASIWHTRGLSFISSKFVLLPAPYFPIYNGIMVNSAASAHVLDGIPVPKGIHSRERSVAKPVRNNCPLGGVPYR